MGNTDVYTDDITGIIRAMALTAWLILRDHPIVVILIIAFNIQSVLVYLADKRFAESGVRRISERTLIFSAMLGTVGALVSMKIFRHKTKKRSFQAKLFAAIAVKILFIIAMLYFLASTQT